MTLTDQHIQRELQTIEAHLARITEQAARLQGERDRLIGMLTDVVGAHHSRAVAVR